MAKRRERRLDQGRAAAEIGVSPSTYRSYEKNTQRPSVNVFPLLAKFLGLEMEEFLTLYATTVIFALRPALEKELALQKDSVAAAAPAEAPPVAPVSPVTDIMVVDAAPEPVVIDVIVEDTAPESVEPKEEGFTYVRDDDAPASPPSDTSEVVDDETFFEEESDDDDDDDDKEDDETADPDTWGEMATPSLSSQFSTFSTGLDGSSKKKKKKKKKK